MKKSKWKHHHRKINYKQRLFILLTHPLFWTLTFIGNAMILAGSLILYKLESHAEKPLQFMDCLLWSTGIVTTIGYVNYVPVTFLGKLTVLALMLLGTFFLWSYMAFLVSVFISPTLTSLEQEVLEVEKGLSDLISEEHQAKNKESL